MTEAVRASGLNLLDPEVYEALAAPLVPSPRQPGSPAASASAAELCTQPAGNCWHTLCCAQPPWAPVYGCFKNTGHSFAQCLLFRWASRVSTCMSWQFQELLVPRSL